MIAFELAFEYGAVVFEYGAVVFGSGAKTRNVKTSSFSDDEPAYDTVASDEDYSSLGDRASIKERSLLEPTKEAPVSSKPHNSH